MLNFLISFWSIFLNDTFKFLNKIDKSDMALDFFMNYLFAPIILLVGLFGNTMGLILVGRKHLHKIGPVLIYKCLFITDSIYLIQIIFTYMSYSFNFDSTVLSSIGCKIYNFFSYGLDALSSWCLVYISIEYLRSLILASLIRNSVTILKQNKKELHKIWYFIYLFSTKKIQLKMYPNLKVKCYIYFLKFRGNSKQTTTKSQQNLNKITKKSQQIVILEL